MVKSARTIIVFTRWFPYNKILEQSFLLDELRQLADFFSEVYVVPQKIEGEKYTQPEKFVVIEELAGQLQKIPLSIKFKVVFSRRFIREILKIRFNRQKIKYAIATCVGAEVTAEWLRNFACEKRNVVLYSFWMDQTAFGSSITDQANLVKRICRCHNFDLYGNEENGFYVPFRDQIVKKLDLVLPDSFEGKTFLKSLYPSSRIETALMGTSDPLKRNSLSNDGIFRVVSCSYMIPRKRVVLFAQALHKLNELNPEIKLHWVHVGDGIEMPDAQDIVSRLGESITVDLKGNLTTDELKVLYDTQNFDLFVNTSTKEGTPVAIIEAISRGIPLMATSFGGGKEIVEKGAGISLSSNPSPTEIAQRIIELVKSDKLTDFSKRSREIWEEHYNSEENYRRFCDILNSDQSPK